MSPTKDECIAAAGEVYGAILADPIRREQIRAGRAAWLREHPEATVGSLNPRGSSAARRDDDTPMRAAS